VEEFAMFRAQQKYKDAQKAKGYVHVSVWVPVESRHRLTKYAEKLRKEKPNVVK
jgi:hypothetical protein